MGIKVLVVDDSALMRRMISDILRSDPTIEVIDMAHNGKDALEKIRLQRPDVITMDVEMPEMNGIEVVKEIMKRDPIPVVMVSALTSQGANVTMDALQAGAVDFICKPSGSISTDIGTMGRDIIQKVKSAGRANLRMSVKAIQTPFSNNQNLPGYQSGKIKTMIVDDSPFFIKTASDIVTGQSDIELVGTASTGKEAIDQFHRYHPDVIIMDLDMPEMNGVEATHAILKEGFVPIIIFSSDTTNDMQNVKLALEVGAVDYIAKPSDGMSMRSISKLFLQKIREASKQKQMPRKVSSIGSEGVLLIGTSTGGPQTLSALIPQIPGDLPVGVLLVQHMPPLFTKNLAERLDKISPLRVKEAQEGDEIQPGLVLIAPGDYHMTVAEKMVNGKRKRYVTLNQDERIHGVRPAVDITFTSAANSYGKNTVAVILTGMGQDGANSMGLVKAKGGYTIAQDEKTSIIFGMPQAAIKLGVVDKILPLDQIPSYTVQMVRKTRGKAG